MRKTIKLSIIIPVYNVEHYVEKCLRSCIEQDLSSDYYEIIVINDGTKDNSLKIAERFAKDYSNITIYSQENEGLSAARNKGLSLAQGEYVWFVDSDDWIKSNCLNIVIEKCTQNSLDVLAICAAEVNEYNSNKSFDYYEKGVITGKQTIIKGLMNVCVPFSIYRKSFLFNNNLRFQVGIFHEDAEFTPRAYYHSLRVSFLNEALYYVFQNPTSITRTPNPKKAFDYILVAISLNKFSNLIDKDVSSMFSYLISRNINNSLANNYEMSEKQKRELNQYIYENKNLFKHLLRSKTLKYILEGFLFYTFPKNSVEVYQLIQKLNF